MIEDHCEGDRHKTQLGRLIKARIYKSKDFDFILDTSESH